MKRKVSFLISILIFLSVFAAAANAKNYGVQYPNPPEDERSIFVVTRELSKEIEKATIAAFENKESYFSISNERGIISNKTKILNGFETYDAFAGAWNNEYLFPTYTQSNPILFNFRYKINRISSLYPYMLHGIAMESLKLYSDKDNPVVVFWISDRSTRNEIDDIYYIWNIENDEVVRGDRLWEKATFDKITEDRINNMKVKVRKDLNDGRLIIKEISIYSLLVSPNLKNLDKRKLDKKVETSSEEINKAKKAKNYFSSLGYKVDFTDFSYDPFLDATYTFQPLEIAVDKYSDRLRVQLFVKLDDKMEVKFSWVEILDNLDKDEILPKSDKKSDVIKAGLELFNKTNIISNPDDPIYSLDFPGGRYQSDQWSQLINSKYFSQKDTIQAEIASELAGKRKFADGTKNKGFHFGISGNKYYKYKTFSRKNGDKFYLETWEERNDKYDGTYTVTNEWLVVKPSHINAEGKLDRFFYPVHTPIEDIKKDMEDYFKDSIAKK